MGMSGPPNEGTQYAHRVEACQFQFQTLEMKASNQSASTVDFDRNFFPSGRFIEKSVAQPLGKCVRMQLSAIV